MTKDDLIRFWEEGSKEAWQTVQALLSSKRYLHALFFCHLTLEKLLKAIYVLHCKQAPPPVHSLGWLAEKAGISLAADEMKQLEEITAFNISGRYEDYRQRLYKKANSVYVSRWVRCTERLMHSIRKQ